MKLASYVQESLRKWFCVSFDFECKVLVVRHLTDCKCVTAAQLYSAGRETFRYWLRNTVSTLGGTAASAIPLPAAARSWSQKEQE